MNKPLAVFICSKENRIFEVFTPNVLALLGEKLELYPNVITEEDFVQQRALLSKAEYIFSTWGMPSLSKETIKEYLPSLKAVFYAAGSVQAFARPFIESSVKVFSAWAANSVPVAEYTVAQIILAGKGFFQGILLDKEKERDLFLDYTNSFPCNYNCKVGILGAGMIGKRVIKMLKPYDLDVLVYDPFVSEDFCRENGAEKASLEEVFSECQTISNHIANLPETVGMLKYEHFSLLKDNATFINTGRGAQVVEADLIKALKEKPCRTALLDVTDPEPPESSSELYSLKNVFLTPHIAGSMKNEVSRMGLYMYEEFLSLIHEKELQYEVTLKMLETMA